MKTIRSLNRYPQIKLLSDPRRLAILRRLMAAPATLTQLGQAFGQSPAWVRHHLKTLERAGLVEIAEVRAKGIVVEKYYRAQAGAFLLQELILPEGDRPVILFSGSHDLAIEQIAGELSAQLDFLAHPVGSLDGLVNLRLGLSQIAGAHLLDETGVYNTPYVSRLFPDRPVRMVTLAHRTQGLLLPPGNPHAIRSLEDLANRNIRLVNRNPGSGTRLWLDRQLLALGIPPGKINGYDDIAYTHTDTALRVQQGQADAAIGLQAAARQHDLDFIPLFTERYDLAYIEAADPGLDILLDHIQSQRVRRNIAGLHGYEVAHTGERVL